MIIYFFGIYVLSDKAILNSHYDCGFIYFIVLVLLLSALYGLKLCSYRHSSLESLYLFGTVYSNPFIS